MKEIALSSLVRSDNPELSIEGSKRNVEFERRGGQICIVSDKEYFYVRNWLAGNKIPYDRIEIRKSELSVADKRRQNLEKARAARKLKKQEQ